MKERLKEPREGSERDPETLCLQTVGVEIRPRTFCRTVRRVMQFGEVKYENVRSRSESEYKMCVKSNSIDPKLCDLSMTRLKLE